MYDVLVIGGGPAGLSAALLLGRAQKRVLLCDGGVPRNATAEQLHNFVTRDGTPPREFRRIAREQLAHYPDVELLDAEVGTIEGERDRFRTQVGSRAIEARRVLLALGMVDELPALPGYRELWGRSIFQCPYCHGWEVRERAFGCLVTSALWLDWALLLAGWSRDLIVFTDGRFELPQEARARFAAASIAIEERPLAQLVAAETSAGPRLTGVALVDGTVIPREVLFARPPQRQTSLVERLALTLDELGFVRVDALTRETSRPGVYAAGDLTTMGQAAMLAAAAGVDAAARLNHELTLAARETPSE
jgi:thioredoxin reductase